ncbi:histone-like nucleoid-structuring protein Lsr2 [Nocardioides dilutus]
MAKTTIVQVSDDLDGSANASEVRFAFEGTEYTIDLSGKNRKALEKALRPYIEAGTKVSGRHSGTARSARSKRSGSARNSAVDLTAVRAWARENGHQVSDRGRLPKAVLDAYTASQ